MHMKLLLSQLLLAVLLLLGNGMLVKAVAADIEIELNQSALSLRAENVPLHSIWRALEQRTHIRFVIPQNTSQQTVSIHLNSMPFERALKRLSEDTGGLIVVRDPASPNIESIAQVFVLQRADSATLSSPPAQTTIPAVGDLPVIGLDAATLESLRDAPDPTHRDDLEARTAKRREALWQLVKQNSQTQVLPEVLQQRLQELGASVEIITPASSPQ